MVTMSKCLVCPVPAPQRSLAFVFSDHPAETSIP
jgi:hypothetical protein